MTKTQAIPIRQKLAAREQTLQKLLEEKAVEKKRARSSGPAT